MKVRFFDPGKEYKQLKKEILPKINSVLSNGDLILRKDVEDFENKLAN
jgi:flagellar basal body-associated protein FliL